MAECHIAHPCHHAVPLRAAACPASSHCPAGAAQAVPAPKEWAHGDGGYFTAYQGVLALSAMTGLLKKPRMRRKRLYHSVPLRNEQLDKELAQAQSDYPEALFYK